MRINKIDAAWGLYAQGFRSLNSFIIGLSFINFFSKNEYGLYGMGFAVLVLLVGLANGAIFSQMTIFVSKKKIN
jgi:hypothetical protein